MSEKKIVTLEALSEIIQRHKKHGKTVVHCHGVFDLMHPGHIMHFEAAKKQGDILVVTITQDQHVNKGPGRPVFTQDVRALTIAALAIVDYVSINTHESATEALLQIRPDVYAKGDEYTDESKDITGGITNERMAVESIGGRLYFTSEPTFSSSELLNRHFRTLSPDVKTFIDKFRQKYSAALVIEKMKKLKSLKVLIIGESIIDEYHYCSPMGKSAKESIVASKYLREESFAGGALACANHAAGFVKRVRIMSCLGKSNSREDFIRAHLKSQVSPKFVYDESRPTIVKRRYVWDPFLVKLFEVVFLDEKPIPAKTEKQVLSILEKELPKYDLVVVTDYGHGFITPKIVKKLSEKSKFLAVNTQTNSTNIGFNLITKYSRADYVCIDDPEIRLAHHDRFGDIRDLIKKTAKQLKAKYITVTRGHLGSLVYSSKNGFAETPILSKEVVDRMGAGDAFLAVTAPCVAAGFPSELVGFIGNAVGALAVRIVGNRAPIESVPLMKFITAILK
ncbi:MAG: PfkB family carbohydrate kinase [Patescibacteria group bacterium]|mgnify:CR=1 FL=1